jgi:hypothetical protein
MSAPLMAYKWDGNNMTPLKRFARQADSLFVIGEGYEMIVSGTIFCVMNAMCALWNAADGNILYAVVNATLGLYLAYMVGELRTERRIESMLHEVAAETTHEL